MDPGMNQLLKWSVENSDATRDDPTASTDPKAVRSDWPSGQGLNAEALNTLMGGPSDADLMRESMVAITSDNVNLENKLVAFDNFEQLIEIIDNANNMENMGLWTPLVKQLESPEADLRRMAAWCVGTAVQNNIKAQDRLLVLGAIPTLVDLAIHDSSEGVRRKAIYALSSEVRNFQPGFNVALQRLPRDFLDTKKVDAGDMEGIDHIMEKLRQSAKKA
ncbi:MAG: hsp70 nucleotide exchange factor fes1 [Pycnora praestabilis]|nr:MAG: hsp70 nucleotide exchange factor fes1 [Pycnora praestabilis]